MSNAKGVSLKDHFDQRFIDSEKALNIALTASQRATDLALNAQKGVNETQNEFRNTLKDQASTLMPRSETESMIDRINADIRGLRESRASLEGKASQSSVYISYLISIASILLAVYKLIK